MLSMKDRIQIARWLKSGATLDEVLNAPRFGLVENERFSERAREVYIWLWTWSAHRFEGKAGRQQNDIYCKYGMAGLYRRFARVNRIIENLKK